MDAKLVSELNKQINEEMFSSYLYLSMAAYFENANYGGFAAWMHAQSREEMGHAMKMFKFLLERGEKVELEAIAKPQASWEKPYDVFKASLAHEQHITSRINHLYFLAKEVKDSAAEIFLQWFVTEQVEEEASVSEVVAKMEMLNEAPVAMYMLSKELGARGAH
ncbi:ferritin [Myxococcota bacterium]|nr:ferritin [Myxococcota bacterium]MBU1382120.1 ferritin [Myxococcota bacterium]MBU1498122.1 ferritin [Myxococcota bacterium]